MPRARVMPDALGDVVERAVAPVAIEHVLAARQARRTARDRHALVAAQPRLGHGRRREIEVDVVGGEQVEAAVAVVVEEGAARAPARAHVAESRRVGHVLERAVARVAEQAVLAPEGDEQILVAVVVVVAGAGALSPARRCQPGRAVTSSNVPSRLLR